MAKIRDMYDGHGYVRFWPDLGSSNCMTGMSEIAATKKFTEIW
jgi:hypothetical protein